MHLQNSHLMLLLSVKEYLFSSECFRHKWTAQFIRMSSVRSRIFVVRRGENFSYIKKEIGFVCQRFANIFVAVIIYFACFPSKSNGGIVKIPLFTPLFFSSDIIIPSAVQVRWASPYWRISFTPKHTNTISFCFARSNQHPHFEASSAASESKSEIPDGISLAWKLICNFWCPKFIFSGSRTKPLRYWIAEKSYSGFWLFLLNTEKYRLRKFTAALIFAVTICKAGNNFITCIRNFAAWKYNSESKQMSGWISISVLSLKIISPRR